MKLSLKRGFGPSGVIFCAFFTFAAMAGAGSYSGGSGTAENPYKISTVADWKELTSIFVSGDWGKNFILLNDIDFGGADLVPVAPDINPSSSGYQGTQFKGTFDGNGHILRNATINQTGKEWVGLFGIIGTGGLVKNLGVENFAVSGARHVGILCGYKSGTIQASFVTGTVLGGDDSQYLGGLCGDSMYGKIDNCYALCSVTGGDGSRFLGGLCGAVEGHSICSNSYSAGPVRSGQNSRYVGGLFGYAYADMISRCYWNRDMAEQLTSSSGWALTETQMKQAASFIGWNNGQWKIDEGNGYPRLFWEDAPGNAILTDYPARSYIGSGTAADPFQLNSAADLVCLGLRDPDWNQVFVLAGDIDMSGVLDYRPVGLFSGRFLGQGHVIQNLTVDTAILGNRQHLGLFGRIGSGAAVENLGLENAAIRGGEGTCNFGILCGSNEGGTITRCHVNGIVSGGNGSFNSGGLCGSNGNPNIRGGTITQCSASVEIVAGDDSSDLGGLCGVNWGGTLSQCFAVGSVTGGNRAREFGGLCGGNNVCQDDLQGTIINCYSTVSVMGGINCSKVGGLCGTNESSSYIEYSYSTGRVISGNGSTQIGGFCGYGQGIGSCFWDIETSGLNTSSGGTGKTTIQMKTYSTFFIPTGTKWDFSRTDGDPADWQMPAYSYPRLAWEIVPHYSGGSGTPADPYQIANAADLIALGNAPADCEKSFILTADIDLAGQGSNPDGSFPRAIIPDFTGRFNGNGYSIWNLTIDARGLADLYLGFFGVLNGGTIENLRLEDTKITSTTTLQDLGGLCGKNSCGTLSNCHIAAEINGKGILGGLCGTNYFGAITDCHSSVEISGKNKLGGLCGKNEYDPSLSRISIIARCSVTGKVSGDGDLGGLCGYNSGMITDSASDVEISGEIYLGGLCGENFRGTIKFCQASGTVTGVSGSDSVGGLCGRNSMSTISDSVATASVIGEDNSQKLGGLCGWNSSTISNCFSTGSVTGGVSSSSLGGLCGYNSSTISSCYATGSITSGEGSQYLGGFCGKNSQGTISTSYATGTVAGTNIIGGLVGENYQGKILHNYSTGKVTGSTNVGGLCGSIVTGGSYEGKINFWDTLTSEVTSSAMGVGRTTDQLQTLSTFTNAGWDFVGEAANGTADVWRMCGDGVSYPRLSWEFSQGGDMDCPDGVELEDLVYLAGRWMASTPSGIGAADADGNGKVDLNDFAILSEQWMK